MKATGTDIINNNINNSTVNSVVAVATTMVRMIMQQKQAPRLAAIFLSPAVSLVDYVWSEGPKPWPAGPDRSPSSKDPLHFNYMDSLGKSLLRKTTRLKVPLSAAAAEHCWYSQLSQS